MLPTIVLLPLVITASLLALALLWPRVRSCPSAGRLAGEVIVTTLALSALAHGRLVAAQCLPW